LDTGYPVSPATYPEARTGSPWHFPIWSCTGWGLPSFPGHPENWCALTAPFHPYPAKSAVAVLVVAVCFLLHLPSRHRDSTLWSILPYGVRTFLPMRLPHRAIIWPAPACQYV